MTLHFISCVFILSSLWYFFPLCFNSALVFQFYVISVEGFMIESQDHKNCLSTVHL